MTTLGDSDAAAGCRLFVTGAAGNLGTRLVRLGLARGHAVTAYVRNPAKLAARLGPLGSDRLCVVEGDALDTAAVETAMAGHDALVNAAGHVGEGRRFVRLVASVLAAGIESLGLERRMWFLGGLAALTVPGTRRIPAGMIGMPPMYRHHKTNWRALAASPANWSLMCPGPMIAAMDGRPRAGLRLSEEVLPYDLPRLIGYMPPPVIPLAMMAMLPVVTVSYEDVADVILRHLAPDSAFARRRVGVALPPGVRQFKRGWLPGLRGPDA